MTLFITGVLRTDIRYPDIRYEYPISGYPDIGYPDILGIRISISGYPISDIRYPISGISDIGYPDIGDTVAFLLNLNQHFTSGVPQHYETKIISTNSASRDRHTKLLNRYYYENAQIFINIFTYTK